MKLIKIFIVVGARPNFMKAAPLIKALKKYPSFKLRLVHTGQHYDPEMSASFFKELRLPKPDTCLGVGSGTQAGQTGKIMIEFEKVCLKDRPDLVVVVGDVNSTLAGALTAAKLGIPVAHVEAGLRSFDRTMPEEINRLVTDQLADFLFTSCEGARRNLIKEGRPEAKIFFVGNVMIDTLLNHLRLAQKSRMLEQLGLKKNHQIRKYALLTLHRPSNVDLPIVLQRIFQALMELAREIPIIFPVHPRTLRQIRKFNLFQFVSFQENLKHIQKAQFQGKMLCLPPLGYLDFLALMSQAAIVLTDSGGIQEETTILGIPCLTLRKNTERPITIQEGTNRIVGNDPERILKAARRVLKSRILRKKIPKYWDGKAAERIVKILKQQLKS